MPPAEYPSDEDDISVTSTAASVQLEEYEINTILAQRTFEGLNQYLVRWEGYPDERCTWEPEDNFCDPTTLKEWRVKSAAIARGDRPKFDVKALEDRISALEQASLERKGRRRAKRFRLGLLLSEEDNGAHEHEEDEPDSLFDFIDDSPVLEDKGQSAGGPPARGNETRTTSQPKPTNLQRQKQSSGSERRKSSQSGVSSGPSSSTGRGPLKASSGISPPPSIPPSSRSNIPTGAAHRAKQLGKRTAPPSAIGISTRRRINAATRMRARQQKGNTSDKPHLFRNLSSQWRYEKATRREPTPDITKLDLRKPEEWLSPYERSERSAPIRSDGLWNHRNNDNSDSLFIQQDEPTPTRFEEPSPIGRSDERSFGGSRRRASLDGKDMRNRPSLQPKLMPGRMYTNRGRFWDLGEVLVTLRFGPDGQDVGEVRICNLNRVQKHQIVDLKERGVIDVWFQNTCIVQEYGMLCEGVGSIPFSPPSCFRFFLRYALPIHRSHTNF